MAQVNLTIGEDILKDLLLGNRENAVAKLLENVFNAVLKAQASEQLNAEPYERSEDRTSYRNGYRYRPLTTRVGGLILHVPKFRNGTFSTELFENYQRSEKALLLSLMEMVIQGVSTRRVSEITETLCGTGFSKSSDRLPDAGSGSGIVSVRRNRHCTSDRGCDLHESPEDHRIRSKGS